CTLHACLASPAGRKKIAHRFIGGCGSGVGQVPEGRKNSTVPGGTRSAPRSVPTDESVGYSRPPRRAGSDACKVQTAPPPPIACTLSASTCLRQLNLTPRAQRPPGQRQFKLQL